MFSREIEGDRILKSSFVYLSEKGEVKAINGFVVKMTKNVGFKECTSNDGAFFKSPDR